MKIRILREDELIHASGLSRFVFDTCLRNRMEFTQTIPFIENYIAESNLNNMYRELRLIIWGAFEQGQLVGVSGMQNDGMITMLYVLPQYAGRGCGSRLLITMQEYAKHTLRLQKITLNATPAWTAFYFQKQGFSLQNPTTYEHVPFVPMYMDLERAVFQRKEKITIKTIVLALLACLGFATVAASVFMISYLF